MLARDYIPVKRNSDGAIGLYELINGKFFGNSGTGTFKAGSVNEGYVNILDNQALDSIGQIVDIP